MKNLKTTEESFIPGIVHDLKTPITSIIGFTELLKSGKKSHEHRNEYYDIIENEAHRLLNMVDDILKVYKTEKICVENEKNEQDINSKIKKILIKLLPIIENQGIKIRTNFEDGLILCINENELIRILTNIIENAVKYSNSYGEVKITTKKQDNKISVKIENEGITLLKEEYSKIFEKFYRGKSAKNSNVKGSGIGLSVVRELVKKSGGEVHTFSHNKKTVFTIEWPISNT